MAISRQRPRQERVIHASESHHDELPGYNLAGNLRALKAHAIRVARELHVFQDDDAAHRRMVRIIGGMQRIPFALVRRRAQHFDTVPDCEFFVATEVTERAVLRINVRRPHAKSKEIGEVNVALWRLCARFFSRLYETPLLVVCLPNCNS